MQLFTIDDKRELLIMPSDDAAATFAAIRFISLAQQAVAAQGSFSVALSGGSTPKKMYEKLLLPQNAERVNWSRVNIFWSDERAVPQDHPDSNYRMAMHYFGKEPLDEAKKFRMPADENDLQLAALDYEKKIKKYCFSERFDLMLLGIGDDAHTASLFPKTEALHVTDKLVVPNFIPQKDSWRMTLTFPCINESRKIIVLAFGKDKGKALKKVLDPNSDPELYPARNIGEGDSPVLYIVDELAASELSL